MVASHDSKNALHHYSCPHTSFEPRLNSSRHLKGVGDIAQTAKSQGHRQQNMPRECQIAAVVRSRAPVALLKSWHVHGDSEHYITYRPWLVFVNVRVAWQAVFGRAGQSRGYLCKEA